MTTDSKILKERNRIAWLILAVWPGLYLYLADCRYDDTWFAEGYFALFMLFGPFLLWLPLYWVINRHRYSPETNRRWLKILGRSIGTGIALLAAQIVIFGTVAVLTAPEGVCNESLQSRSEAPQ